MKLEKLSIDGKKDSLDVTDKIFTTKVNKQLVSNILYKLESAWMANYGKGDHTISHVHVGDFAFIYFDFLTLHYYQYSSLST